MEPRSQHFSRTCVTAPRGFCHTWPLAPPGHGKRFTAILLLGTASAMAQQDPGICGGKVQGETKVTGGKFAALSASPEKQKVKSVLSTIQMTSSFEILQLELLCDKVSLLSVLRHDRNKPTRTANLLKTLRLT